MRLPTGALLGPYEILSPLGAGGMGEVYRARDTRLDRTVAIKVLPAGFTADPQLRDRFEREARTVSALDHPNICALYDVGEQDGRAYLVMQYLEGETLASRLERRPLPIDHALRVAIEIGDALDKAHRLGIVHRDLKPANIMLTQSGARLLDFGLAKQVPILRAGASDADVTRLTPAGNPHLTASGTILGTLHYMAPEQLRGQEADARSDIYAFGAVLHEMLSGRPPFDAADPATLIAAILDRQPAPLAAAVKIPPRLERAIAACLEKDPAERWQSSRDLLRELRWLAADPPEGVATAVAARRVRALSRREWIIAAVGVAGAALTGSWAAVARNPAPALPPVPVVVLMDSPHPARVYDPAAVRAGGTNADDLTDLLGDTSLALLKETTGTKWHREDQVLGQNPDLIMVHRSCFYDSTLLGDPALDAKYVDELYAPAADKLESFLGYIALGNPRTRFIVYSRGSWDTVEEALAWVASVERRFPAIRGRLTAYKVPLDRATFRNETTGAEIKEIALRLLKDLGR